VERLLAWYRVGSSVGAVVALVVANAIPLIGVLFLGWSVWNILVIYWLENGIVGVLNVLKMARAEGPVLERPGPMTLQVNGRPAPTMAKAALIPFFVLHYGIFWFVHGVFVFTLPLFASASGEPLATPMTLSAGSIAFAAVALAVSHGLSYWWNFLRGGEYRRVSAAGQMFAPYRRLIALHLTIIFGAIAITLTGAPATAIAVLVGVKTLLDLGLHLSEHRTPATSGATIAN
jgi:Family of unknown function (DUF6498)